MNNLLKILLISVFMLSLAGCSEPVTLPDVEYTSYTDSDNFYSIDVPANWEIKEEHEDSSQFWSRIHMSPPGYTNDTFPNLISVSVSNFNYDTNISVYELTNTILSKEDINYGDFRASKLTLQNKTTEAIDHAYILEYLSGQSIVFHLRSDDPEYVAILKHVWESFNSKR